jgi:hypothetical protein
VTTTQQPFYRNGVLVIDRDDRQEHEIELIGVKCFTQPPSTLRPVDFTQALGRRPGSAVDEDLAP